MKLAFAWGLLVAIAAVNCSVSHRSGDYACTKQTDCASPRVCTDGYCVVPGDVPIDAPMTEPKDGTVVITPDAPKPPPDSNTMSVCPAACTECDITAKTCKIDCGSGNCGGAVQCPVGYDCTINCSAPNSCRNGVFCTGDSACTILCNGSGTCRNVACGNGPCDIECTGQGSCRGITCGQSCACDVSCGDGSTCQQITCSNGPLCSDFQGGCDSTNTGCDTCTN